MFRWKVSWVSRKPAFTTILPDSWKTSGKKKKKKRKKKEKCMCVFAVVSLVWVWRIQRSEAGSSSGELPGSWSISFWTASCLTNSSLNDSVSRSFLRHHRYYLNLDSDPNLSHHHHHRHHHHQPHRPPPSSAQCHRQPCPVQPSSFSCELVGLVQPMVRSGSRGREGSRRWGGRSGAGAGAEGQSRDAGQGGRAP